jgi:CRISPR-associated endonuclease/helicase Cas3
MDVLLQRIGRLHRHLRTDRPDRWRQPVVYVVAPPGGMEPLINGAKTLGLGLVYADLRILQLTLEQIEARGLFVIPDDCRQLIEQTTCPLLLEACGERNDAWKSHTLDMEGKFYSMHSLAATACMKRDVDWMNVDLSAWLVDEQADTRLGIKDYRLPVSWPGAFADCGGPENLSAIQIPGRWVRGIEFDDIHVGGTWEVTARERIFRYGRHGLEP